MRKVFLFFLSVMAAQATALFTSPGTNTNRTGDGFSLGARFTLTAPPAGGLRVVALGIYDPSGGGFLVAHDVGLWDVTAGNIEIASATVPSGTAAPIVNGFRYVDLPVAIDLVDGDTYIIGAYYPSGVDDRLLDHIGGTNATMSSEFTSVAASFTGSNAVGHLSEPTGNSSGTGYIGPNMLLDVPEPETIGMLCAGLTMLGVLRRRLRRNVG